ncbi:ubiquitin-like protein 7 isoform X2 [Littorina saxatilis]|uniref:UBA domain-containing protein n=1 Tax=Littorina saxatilis TaxID=31220 RepID=A0AAN9C2M1_9CAEN
MTSIRVCVCDFTAGNKIHRFPVNIQDPAGKVDALFSEVANELGSNENGFEMFYCGQKLEREVNLEAINLTPQSTVYVFRKPPAPKESPNAQKVGEKVLLIQRAVQNPNYRKTVDQIMTNSKSLQKLLSAVPGLDEDPIILSMLQDPELLQILAHRQNIYKVCKKHPLFEAAAVYIAGVVSEEHARDSTRARGNMYSLDQMSDDEDEGSQRGAAGGGVPQQQITASQLAAALAAATATATASAPRPSTSATSPAGATRGGPSASGSATSVISPDFFQQAMMTAQNTALDAQLQQMRDMGISDERAARQALNATGGDLQAALDLIFGDNTMD